MQEDIAKLEQRVISHMGIGSKKFKSFSVIERIRYVNEALTNTRDYCCALLGLDPKEVDTRLIFGANANGSAGGKKGKGGIALNVLSALTINNPLYFYKFAGHEMRHIYQQTLDKDNPETVSLYKGPLGKSRLDWAASKSEIGADKFGYGTMLRLATKGMIKGENRVSPADVASLALGAANSASEHLLCSIAYKIVSPFRESYKRSLADQSEVGTYKPKGVAKVRVISMKEIEKLAVKNPILYNQYLNPSVLPKYIIEDAIQDVAADVATHIKAKESHLKAPKMPSGAVLMRNARPTHARYTVEKRTVSSENQTQEPSQPVIDPTLQPNPAAYVVGVFVPPEMQTLPPLILNKNENPQETQKPQEQPSAVFGAVIENILATRQGALEVDAGNVMFETQPKSVLTAQKPLEESFTSSGADVGGGVNLEEFLPEQ